MIAVLQSLKLDFVDYSGELLVIFASGLNLHLSNMLSTSKPPILSCVNSLLTVPLKNRINLQLKYGTFSLALLPCFVN